MMRRFYSVRMTASNAPATMQNAQLEEIRQQVSATSRAVTRLGSEIDSLRSVLASELFDIQRSVFAYSGRSQNTEVVPPLRQNSLDMIFEGLQSEYPRAFPVWKMLFEN